MKNKRGDISITILVIGVIAICAFALLSFLNASFYARQKFVGIEEMNFLEFQIEEYYFYKEKGFSNEEIGLIINIEDNKISVERNFQKLFGLAGEEFLFSVEYSLK